MEVEVECRGMKRLGKIEIETEIEIKDWKT